MKLRIETPEDIELLVEKISVEVLWLVKSYDIPIIEARRDYDGVSELRYLIEKLVGERLTGEMSLNESFQGLTIINKRGET